MYDEIGSDKTTVFKLRLFTQSLRPAGEETFEYESLPSGILMDYGMVNYQKYAYS